MNKEVTVVITSCKRQDLLKLTFDSLIATNTYPIKKYIIIEDSSLTNINNFLKTDYPELDILLLYNNSNIGQAQSIDRAYSYVDTQYIFHCEDDWEFYKGGYIEYTFKIIDNSPKILSCWLREDGDTNGMPVEPERYYVEDISYRLMSHNWRDVWGGFTWNPTLFNIDHYKEVGDYSTYVNEHIISMKYRDLGYRAAKCDGGYVRHIGWGRHV